MISGVDLNRLLQHKKIVCHLQIGSQDRSESDSGKATHFEYEQYFFNIFSVDVFVKFCILHVSIRVKGPPYTPEMNAA